MTRFVLLFVQHGMTDTPRTLTALARLLLPEALVVAPALGYWRTVWRYQPLLDTVCAAATAALRDHPDQPIQIVATSLGGVLWVDLLSQHPEWWSRIQSLVLLGAPIGGAELAYLLPTGTGRALCCDRRAAASTIAAQIPTLAIAGRSLGASDGTVSITSTQFEGCTWECLEGVWHSQLRYHPQVVRRLRDYWQS